MRTWFQRTFLRPSWEDNIQECKTIAQICDRVRRWVKYSSVSYELDIIPGKEVWSRGYGDCGHIASCIKDLCKIMGKDAYIRRVYNESFSQGHAMAYGPIGDKLWVSSNGSYEIVEGINEIDCIGADVLDEPVYTVFGTTNEEE